MCQTIIASHKNSENLGITSEIVGASATISLVIHVNLTIQSGICLSGFTKVWNSCIISQFLHLIAAISVIHSLYGVNHVVSKSSTTYSEFFLYTFLIVSLTEMKILSWDKIVCSKQTFLNILIYIIKLIYTLKHSSFLSWSLIFTCWCGLCFLSIWFWIIHLSWNSISAFLNS